jgi:signal transduction histidine kinase
MRLGEFILSNVEPILAEWETFARGMAPGGEMDSLALRDHAEEILRAAARDMASAQTGAQQSSKSRGRGGAGGAAADRLNGASEEHACGRVECGFGLMQVVSEYRALRASVIRLWRESKPAPDDRDLADLTRFNESIDQSLTKAVSSFTKRVDDSREMFLAILGHDLRGPLFAIGMSAEAVRRTPDLDPDAAEYLAQITDSTAVMSGMVRDLLDFTRTRLGGGLPVERASMDLDPMCRDVLAEVRAARPACAIRYDHDGDLAGEWDAARLRQVVSNLVWNAVQHGTGQCTVGVSARVEGGDVVLAVRNDGPPIPPEERATLFDPLVRRRALNQAGRKSGSIGLGLYIVREIVVAHGGTIDVESSPDAGTVFTARLPRRHKIP